MRRILREGERERDWECNRRKSSYLRLMNELKAPKVMREGSWLVVPAPFGRVKVEFRKDTRRQQQQQQKAQQWHFFYVFLGKYTH